MNNYERAKDLVEDWIDDFKPYNGVSLSTDAKDDLIARIATLIRGGIES